MVRVHLVPHLGDKRLDRLTVADPQRFANGRLAASHTPTTVQDVATLGAAPNRATRGEVLTRNVAQLVTLPSSPPTTRPLWAPDQLSHFLDASREDPLYPALTLMARYGLRRGPGAALVRRRDRRRADPDWQPPPAHPWRADPGPAEVPRRPPHWPCSTRDEIAKRRVPEALETESG